MCLLMLGENFKQNHDFHDKMTIAIAKAVVLLTAGFLFARDRGTQLATPHLHFPKFYRPISALYDLYCDRCWVYQAFTAYAF